MVAIVWLPHNKELIALFCSTPNVLHTTFVSMNAIVAFAFHSYMSSLFGKKGRQEPPFISTCFLQYLDFLPCLFFVFCFCRVSGTVWIIESDHGLLKFHKCWVIIINTSYQIPKTNSVLLISVKLFIVSRINTFLI